MESFIIPSVEISDQDIPSRPFFRGTKKISLKIIETGIVITGNTIEWSEILDVSIKFFNSNPYIQLNTKSGSVYSFFFENKFYYRRNAPWFGASEFITREFVKKLEEKNLYSIAKLEAQIYENKSTPRIHYIWNNFTYVFPVVLLVISTIILLLGWVGGPQIRI